MTIQDMFKRALAGSYELKVRCKNCKRLNIIQIPKGRTIDEFKRLTRKVCENCGVRFRKDDEKEVEVE